MEGLRPLFFAMVIINHREYNDPTLKEPIMGAFDISYNDIAGAPLGSGRKKVAPIQAAQGIAAPTAALSTPQVSQ